MASAGSTHGRKATSVKIVECIEGWKTIISFGSAESGLECPLRVSQGDYERKINALGDAAIYAPNIPESQITWQYREDRNKAVAE